jgi:preprotein translocase subunit SecE
VARDRQRAKQRRARRTAQNPGPAPSEPHRENVPGELEHASGEVDEFEAALVEGADGETADAEPAGGGAVDDEPFDEALDEAELRGEDQPARRGRGAATAAPVGAEAPERQGALARLRAFMRASWAELQRVQWPDRKQVAQATAVVLGFVIVAGLYLGVADRVAQEVVDLII